MSIAELIQLFLSVFSSNESENLAKDFVKTFFKNLNVSERTLKKYGGHILTSNISESEYLTLVGKTILLKTIEFPDFPIYKNGEIIGHESKTFNKIPITVSYNQEYDFYSFGCILTSKITINLEVGKLEVEVIDSVPV